MFATQILKRRSGPARPRSLSPRAVVFALVALCCISALSAGADDSFREFPDEQVPTPEELFHELSGVWAGELQQLLNDRYRLSDQEWARRVADSFGPSPSRPRVDPVPGVDTPERVDAPTDVNALIERVREEVNRLSNPTRPPPVTPGPNGSDPSNTSRSTTARSSIADSMFQRPDQPTDETGEQRQSNSEFRRTVRDEFNRLLLDSAQDILTDTSEDPAGASTIQSLFREVAEEAQETMSKDDGSFRRAVLGALSDVKSNVRRSDASYSESRGTGLGDSDASYMGGDMRWIWAVLGLFVLGVAVFLFRHRLAASFSKYSDKVAARARMRIQLIRSRRDLVDAFDRVLLWVLGPRASWWSGREIERELVTNDPELALHISELVADYEVARYAPESHAISMARLTRSAQTLSQLATTYHAREQRAANEQ